MSNQKQYKRTINPGDYQIVGEKSNGINISKNGNNYIYSGNDEEFLQAVRDGKISIDGDKLDVNDPNNIGSFIGIFVQDSVKNIKLGNNTQQSLNINNTSSTLQEIIQPSPTEPPSTTLPIKESIPTPTPTPPVNQTEEEINLQTIEFEELPVEETPQIFEEYNTDQVLNEQAVLDIESGKSKINEIINTDVSNNILEDIKRYVKFSDNALKDWNSKIINFNLIRDIAIAAKRANLIVTITTAKTGHGTKSKSGFISRHVAGNGVDVAIINGEGSNGATNTQNGNPKFRERGNLLKNELIKLGYTHNKESNIKKAVLWQTNIGGNHYNHLHISNTIR